MKTSTCIHCHTQIYEYGEKNWRSDSLSLSQYCWVDPEKGSQLHEPVKVSRYSKKFYESDNGWEILDPDGGFICTVYSEDSADRLLSHLNRG